MPGCAVSIRQNRTDFDPWCRQKSSRYSILVTKSRQTARRECKKGVKPLRKVDIRAYKPSLRDKAKAMRRGMDPEEKAQMDRQITDRICSLYQYREAQTLLC